MAFKKIDRQQLPPRQWLLIGYPTAGKSTFSTQMKGPSLIVDADHRYAEVSGLAPGEVYQLSDNPADNVHAEQIVSCLRANIAGSGVRTIIVDSLTSILTPLVVEAILDNDAGRNKNRVSAFKNKALSLRLLQDCLTGYGLDVLWIAHLRSGMDGRANERETTTVSAVELARLRRSLNMQLRVVEQQGKRGIVVDWARRGRQGMTLWDDTGCWRGMPERIEQAVYSGLTVEDMERIEQQIPTEFASREAAIAWGFEQGCFKDAAHAANAYDKLKGELNPTYATQMWAAWVENVKSRKAESVKEN